MNGRCLYAIKTLNKVEMIDRNKINRVKVEEAVLEKVDHPFLPTMYARFQTERHVNFVMEYCEGGELFELLMAQPKKRFSEQHMRFYAAEVLLALQYLHLLGYIYRDLKPENVLLNANGHIVLSDFDLSYAAETKPIMRKIPVTQHPMRKSNTLDKPFKHRRGSMSKVKSIEGGMREMVVVAEPEAKANSFVGTEEYLSPEIINASGHDGAVDWWSLGIFMFELFYGVTPFRGSKRDETFDNVLNKRLSFPKEPEASPELKDILTQLLQKNPQQRMGAADGAEELKRHPFFADIDFTFIRQTQPPFVHQEGAAAAQAGSSSGKPVSKMVATGA
uniref:non-specific serine/threonine protein kinase n=1 Tax=Pyramimonas obovata TaxID=1411642 RepID=A0A7S0N7L7_9CHLO|mmetsp:Transcript_21837/g.47933  ORF Transcript_21837/g.47933 Transcript_21837/m.47933 type:complete len:333 (+) Transcript_21837:1431-2429(+)